MRDFAAAGHDHRNTRFPSRYIYRCVETEHETVHDVGLVKPENTVNPPSDTKIPAAPGVCQMDGPLPARLAGKRSRAPRTHDTDVEVVRESPRQFEQLAFRTAEGKCR